MYLWKIMNVLTMNERTSAVWKEDMEKSIPLFNYGTKYINSRPNFFFAGIIKTRMKKCLWMNNALIMGKKETLSNMIHNL